MLKRPKLIILANAFVSEKSIGGGDIFIIQASSALAKSANTTILTPAIGYHHWTKLQSIKAKFIVLKESVFDNRDNPIAIMLAYIFRSLQAINILRKNNPAHILTASQYLPDILPALIHKIFHPNTRWTARIYHLLTSPTKRVGNPLINFSAFFMQRLMIACLKKADLILADNPDTIKQLKKHGFNVKKIKLLISGTQYKKIANHKPKNQYPFDAAYIGRLDPHKGIFDLPEIWKKVTTILPNIKLAIAGYGPKTTTEKLKSKFSELNLQTSVKFIGFLPHKKNNHNPLYDLLKSTKVLLLPNHEGGWPLTVAEAMAAKLPVVTYNLPIFKSIYKHGVLTAPMKNKTIFAKHVAFLLTNEQRRKKLAQEGQNQAKLFDIKEISKQFSKLVFNNT